MSDTLEQAIAAIRAGDKNTGGQLLNQVLQTDPRNETAWLWMTAVVGSDEERRKILEYVLSINPSNETARNSLAKLKPPASPATDVQVDSPREQQAETSLQPAHKSEESDVVKKCPYCAEIIKAEAVVCRFCGKDLQMGQSSSTAADVNQDASSASLLLGQYIRKLVDSGWEVVFQTPTEAKLKKPKRLSLLTSLLFVVNSFALLILPEFLHIAGTDLRDLTLITISSIPQTIFIAITFSGIIAHFRKKEMTITLTETEITKGKIDPLEKSKHALHSKIVKRSIISIFVFFVILSSIGIFVGSFIPQGSFLVLPAALIIYVMFLYSYSFRW